MRRAEESRRDYYVPSSVTPFEECVTRDTNTLLYMFFQSGWWSICALLRALIKQDSIATFSDTMATRVIHPKASEKSRNSKVFLIQRDSPSYNHEFNSEIFLSLSSACCGEKWYWYTLFNYIIRSNYCIMKAMKQNHFPQFDVPNSVCREYFCLLL